MSQPPSHQPSHDTPVTNVTGATPTVNVAPVQSTTPADPPPLIYLRLAIPAFFSLLVILICGYKIITNPGDNPNTPVYWSALTGTASAWLPSMVNQATSNQRKHD